MAASSERDPAIDATRGLALLGILIANISFFAMPGGVAGTWWREAYPGWADLAAAAVIRGLFENTFILIFSALFGWGAARQLAARPASRFRRRLFGLAAIGVLHALLFWAGDILLAYALIGAMLPFAVHWPRSRLLRTGLLLWAVAVLGNAGVGVLLVTLDPPLPDAGAAIALYRSADVLGMAQMRMAEWAEFYGFGIIVLFPLVAASCLAGVAAHRWLAGRSPDALMPVLTRIAHLVFWPGILGNIAYALLATAPKSIGDGALIAPEIVLRALFSPMLALLLLVGSLRFFTSPAGAALVTPFRFNGRMSLSIYVLQSLVCVVLFHGYGAGLYASIGPAGSLAAAIAIFAVMTLFAYVWLRAFGQGPLEALLGAGWRTQPAPPSAGWASRSAAGEPQQP